jgi:large subunit ribosomal protein L10
LALTKQQKEKIVAEYADKFSKSQALILADYRGMTVANITRLRRQLRGSGNAFVVVKNSLAEIALRQAGRPIPKDVMVGPMAIGLCYTDIASVVKTFNEVAQETKILTIRGAILGNRVVNADQAKALADLPSREVLLAQVVGTIQAPLVNLVSVLAGPMRGLVTVLQGRADKIATAE